MLRVKAAQAGTACRRACTNAQSYHGVRYHVTPCTGVAREDDAPHSVLTDSSAASPLGAMRTIKEIFIHAEKEPYIVVFPSRVCFACPGLVGHRSQRFCPTVAGNGVVDTLIHVIRPASMPTGHFPCWSMFDSTRETR